MLIYGFFPLNKDISPIYRKFLVFLFKFLDTLFFTQLVILLNIALLGNSGR